MFLTWRNITEPLRQKNRKRNFLTNALTLEMKKQIKAAVDENAPFFAYMTHYAVHQRHDQPDPNGDYDTYPSGTSFEPGVSIGGNLAISAP